MNDDMKFKWEKRDFPTPPPRHGDRRRITLDIDVFFEWSDKIPSEIDEDTGEVLEYKSGFIMKPMPNRSFLYNGQETIHLGQVKFEP